MKLRIFDFDSTLFKKPEIYDWEPNDNEEDNDYMESPQSLEYEFEIHEKVIEKYKKAKVCSKSKTVLLTNRTHKLKSEVTELLKENGIDFDYHLFREEDRSKGNRLINLIEKIPHKVEYVEYYDDKHKHLRDIHRVSTIYSDIDFQINKVFEDFIVTCQSY